MFSYTTQILSTFEITLKLFFVSLFLSIPLGAFIALCRISKITSIRKITEVYIWLLRGTPLLLQLVLIYFGLPNVGIVFDRMPAAYVAFVLNYAAYFGEIFRSGIQSIERGQIEAARVLGFKSYSINMKIVLPQVIKRTLPSIGNEVITLVKDTSLIHILGVSEILKAAKGIANRDATLMPYVIAGALYLIMTYVITKLFERIEKKVYYSE